MVASRWWDSSPAPTGIPWSPDVTTPAPGSEFTCACNCPAVQAVDCTGRDRVVAYCPWGDKLSWFAAGLGCLQLLRWLKWFAGMQEHSGRVKEQEEVEMRLREEERGYTGREA